MKLEDKIRALITQYQKLQRRHKLNATTARKLVGEEVTHRG